MITWVLVAVLLPLALIEMGELAPWLAARCIRAGTRLLPGTRARERFAEEWCAGLDRVPGKLTKLCFAIGIVMVAVPILRVVDRRAEREVPGMWAACDRAVSAFADVDSPEALAELIAHSGPAVLGFRDVVVGLEQPDGCYRVVAVGGPLSLRETLMGKEVPRKVLEGACLIAEKWGTLRFLNDPAVFEQCGVTVYEPPERPGGRRTPDTWEREYCLIAPLYGQDGHLVGKISMDEPLTDRCPGPAHQAVIEHYAAKVANRLTQLTACTTVTGA